MKIFPAIDIIDNKAVRLFNGDYDKKVEYSTDPLSVALSFKQEGASFLHLVDLDGAKLGACTNFETIKNIVLNTDMFVEVGGGIRTLDRIEMYLNLGVKRVILGTSAIKDPSFLQEAVKKYKNYVAVGVDTKNGYIAIDGWKTITNVNGVEYVKYLSELGVETAICTDISKDGAMKGTNLEFYKNLSKIKGINITASGGITYIEEIKALKNMGVYGAILGKSMYENKISLKEAIIVGE